MKKRIFAIITLLIFICAGCSREGISSAEAAEIIEEFNSQDYSYTMKIYNLGTDGSEDILNERKGMKTEDPYRQYEITTKDSPDGEYEKYWIENGDTYNCYFNFILSGEISDWIPTSGGAQKEARGTAYYDRNGLEYKFERDEEQYYVVYTEYELNSPYNAILLGLSDDPNETINMDTSTKVEFYIDKEAKKVDRIRVLLQGLGRISEIQTLVDEGMEYEEAVETVDETDQYSYPVYDYQIEYTDDIVINIPNDFTVN